MNKDIIKKLFPEYLEKIENGKCPLCNEIVQLESFDDDLSRKEYAISGLCQSCQNETFES